MSDLFTEPRVLSLSELAAGVSRVISAGFPGLLWVRAEVAKLNHYPESGHCYPALVEKDKGKILAELRGTIWANDFQRINRNFLQVTREPLREGIHILFRARVSFHPVYGLSLQIADIDPSYTLGEMAREKLATIEKLKKEGLFDLNRQKPFPVLPKKIAVISVKTSKGFSDFINILQNNSWGYAFQCVLFPALLQGDKAVESILERLVQIRSFADRFDVVAIIRGGGGDVGLNCYDHFALASAVAAFPIPVLTGIGHSTNETVTEMVAGRNLITPTDLGYFLIQQFHNYSARIQELAGEITSLASDLIEDEKRRRTNLEKRMILGSRALTATGRSGLELLSRGLEMRVAQAIRQQSMRISVAESQVRALDPVNVLKRGFSITYANGRILKDASEAAVGDTLVTRLYSGTLSSEIKSKTE